MISFQRKPGVLPKYFNFFLGHSSWITYPMDSVRQLEDFIQKISLFSDELLQWIPIFYFNQKMKVWFKIVGSYTFSLVSRLDLVKSTFNQLIPSGFSQPLCWSESPHPQVSFVWRNDSQSLHQLKSDLNIKDPFRNVLVPGKIWKRTVLINTFPEPSRALSCHPANLIKPGQPDESKD